MKAIGTTKRSMPRHETISETINGVTYTSPYTTKFQIIMDKGNNSMVIMNTISYITYTCRREK